MKVSKNFSIQEFVPPEIFNKFGEKSIWFIRPEIIKLAQFYRDWFEASVTVNNWHYGGSFKYRGFRPPQATVGAKLSQHRFGCAFDCDVKGMTAEQVRKELLNNEKLFMKAGLTTIEKDVNWLHSDIRKTDINQILIV